MNESKRGDHGARGRWRAGAIAVLAAALLPGCGDSSSPVGPSRPGAAATSAKWQSEFLTNAIDLLDRLDEFDYDRRRDMLVERGRSETLAEQIEADGLMAGWVSHDMLRQAVNRLNQWTSEQEPPADWKPDPLAADLPESCRDLPEMQGLGELKFSAYDGFALREAFWLRDVSNWVRGGDLGELARAQQLFDWTVRNIQLEPQAAQRLPLVPWETLLFGRGTELERAWVFLLLARQQGLDAAMLALENPNAEEPAPPKLWAVGVLCDGEVYPFLVGLGLPVPAADGIALEKDGPLQIRPATLAEIAADDALLRQLDYSTTQRYPLEAGELARVVALLEASPSYLACRMAMLESRLVGEQKTVLSVDPTAQAKRFEAVEGIAGARLWTVPYDTLRARREVTIEAVRERLLADSVFFAMPGSPLYKGRLCYLEGRLSGTHSAASYFQLARPSFEQLASRRETIVQSTVSAAREKMAGLSQDEMEAALGQIAQKTYQQATLESLVLIQAKQSASYWLGLNAYEQPNFPSAVDYFAKRTIEAMPDGFWTHGARYNLGRTYEALGQYDVAIEQYTLDSRSPSYAGNLLRARWLRAQVGEEQPERGVAEPEVEPPMPEAPAPTVKEPETPAPSIQEPEAPAPSVTEPETPAPAVEEPEAPEPMFKEPLPEPPANVEPPLPPEPAGPDVGASEGMSPTTGEGAGAAGADGE